MKVLSEKEIVNGLGAVKKVYKENTNEFEYNLVSGDVKFTWDYERKLSVYAKGEKMDIDFNHIYTTNRFRQLFHMLTGEIH